MMRFLRWLFRKPYKADKWSDAEIAEMLRERELSGEPHFVFNRTHLAKLVELHERRARGEEVEDARS